MPMSDATILSLSAAPRLVPRHRMLDTDRAHSLLHVAQIVLIDPFTANVGVGGATEDRVWL
jgi:hypothetical protein